jgi:hypothetical protein
VLIQKTASGGDMKVFSLVSSMGLNVLKQRSRSLLCGLKRRELTSSGGIQRLLR